MSNFIGRLFVAFLRLFFRLLYHQFAWTYDGVAWLVSIGQWNNWITAGLPEIQGERILELGFGPGHLQVPLNTRHKLAVGLDASSQMGRITLKRLRRKHLPARLALGKAQNLPFPMGCFECAVSTFPSDYIFDPQTLAELRRVIEPGGRLVVISAAWITGQSLQRRFWRWVFRVTYQTPASLSPQILAYFKGPFERAGFEMETRIVKQPSADILVLLARNPTSQ